MQMKQNENNTSIVQKALKVIKDGFINSWNGFGTSKDPVTNTYFTIEEVPSKYDLENLYRFNWLARRIVEIPASDALREGWTWNLESEDEQAIKEMFEVHNLETKLWQAAVKARLYGAAFIYCAAIDGMDVSEPLNRDAINGIDFFEVMDRHELAPVKFYTDFNSGKFGQVEIYSYSPSTSGNNNPLYIHETRLVKFDGNMLGTDNAVGNSMYGDSVLVNLQRDLKVYDTSIQACGQIIQDFVSKIWKIPNLVNYLEQPTVFQERMRLNLMSSSNFSGTVLGEDEEMMKLSTPVSGLDGIVSILVDNVSAAAGIVKTRLFGESLGTFSGADSSRRTHQEDISGYQKSKLQKPIEDLTDLLLLDRKSSLSYDAVDYNIEFHPIMKPTQKESLEMRKLNAETYAIDIQNMVLSPNEVAESTYGSGEYSFERQIDIDSREEMESLELQNGEENNGNISNESE